VEDAPRQPDLARTGLEDEALTHILALAHRQAQRILNEVILIR
jgi:hypothetical protein